MADNKNILKELLEISETRAWLKGYLDGIEYTESQLGKKIKQKEG